MRADIFWAQRERERKRDQTSDVTKQYMETTTREA